jgi:hypothetical protein
MVDIYEYSLTPKYEHIVKAITKYKCRDERNSKFNLVRIFSSVEILLYTYKPVEETVIEIDTVLGESIWTVLENKYHYYSDMKLKGYCGIDFSCDMPDDVREKLKEDPNCDLDEELDWYNHYGYWNQGPDSEPEPDDPEEKFYDDLWTYTPFSITFIKHEPPTPPRPQTPPPPPIVPYEYALAEPPEEMSWDNVQFENPPLGKR